MVDFHSHILPEIDDGSRSVEMTREMLRASREQGIRVMAATPHFYADRMRPEEFLRRRNAAYERIYPDAVRCGVLVLCGAEVAFFHSMSKAEALDSLLIGRSNLLLLEMPFREWTDNDLEEVYRITQRGILPIAAHLERFYPLQTDKSRIKELIKLPILVQINGETLLNWRTQAKAVRLFRNQTAELLGSDCHNLDDRAQNLGKSRSVLEKKLGSESLRCMDRRGIKLLGLE